MKNVFRFVLALAVVAFGLWLWQVIFPSPKKIIIKRLQKLARSASVRPGEGYIPRMADAQAVGGYFSTNVELNLDLPGHRQQTIVSRDDIVQQMMGAHLNGGLTVKFQDIAISVGADKQTAQAEITVEAQMQGEQDLLAQEMKFTLQKIDGKWLIIRVQTIRTFS